MEERDELKSEMEQELQWVKYRQKMLDVMEEKLLQMRQLAEKAKDENYDVEELERVNAKINNLASQIGALDSESRKMECGRILE